MTHRLTLKDISPVTHDTYRLTLTKPDGFEFKPGQATEFAIDKDGWRAEKRPFTFTSLPSDDNLEFTIKSYPDHDGVTEQIAKLKTGDTVLIEDAWGAIEDKGDGVFLAGGAGITPFISILRQREKDGTLSACTLIFSNKTEKDIILREEWKQMKGLGVMFTVSDGGNDALKQGRIDKTLLCDTIAEWEQHFYICGPDSMVTDLAGILREIGVTDDKIVHEEFG